MNPKPSFQINRLQNTEQRTRTKKSTTEAYVEMNKEPKPKQNEEPELEPRKGV